MKHGRLSLDAVRTILNILKSIRENQDPQGTQKKVDTRPLLLVIRLVSSSLDTDNKDYSIEIICDDNVLYKGTWDTLESRSATEKGMVCFEDEIDNQYILNFLGNYYSKSFEVKVYDSKATFSLFQIKYHNKV